MDTSNLVKSEKMATKILETVSSLKADIIAQLDSGDNGDYAGLFLFAVASLDDLAETFSMMKDGPDGGKE